ncbi:hypothetical protein GI584_14375 [Gracilibacillus salitolerans]|uniref:Uncharacterized protein n=1 Tax=Gracilibacillus salitolerans TaxID=2663022 RepID=A0A5Q2TQK0_9BACI|nr:hypothetical protein [Gracilibacillus salitolerans]QGH35158.1 hypothetical protein GI584_14375 [Gracilibacillus salitolerans]
MVKTIEENIDENLLEFRRYQLQLKRIADEDIVKRINVLAKRLIFIGCLASLMYKREHGGVYRQKLAGGGTKYERTI